MNFIPCILLAFPLLTEERCTFSHNEFSCRGTNDKTFFQEFYSSHISYSSLGKFSIDIEESHFNAIEYFPNLLRPDCNFTIASLTIRNSSVRHVCQKALKELSYLETLDLSWNKLENLTFVEGLPKRLKLLYLHNNNVTSLADVFKKLRSLVILDISYNKIKTVDFNHIYWIEELDLSHNSIDTLIAAKFYSHLSKVDLSYNELSKFSEEILGYSVNYLDLSHNKLSRVELGNNEKSYLNMSGNNIVKLTTYSNPAHNKLTSDWVQISDLDLSSTNVLLNCEETKIIATKRLLFNNNKIPILDTSTFDIFDHYRRYWRGTKPVINLSNSSIDDISEHYFSLLELPLLNLSWNNINRLRSNTFSTSVLHTLDLSFSNIYNIESDAFRALVSEKVILSNNKISNIKNVFNGANISELDLSSNPLNIIKEKSFVNSHGLLVLNLSNCSIEKIENLAFFGVADLNLIDLAYNKLYILESNTFHNLPVASLKFPNNRVHTIQRNTFINLNNLRELNLSQVGLNNLEPYAFQNLSNTEVVDLRNNDIKIIPSYLFVNMDNLKLVYLEGNCITTLNPFPNRVKFQLLTLSFNGIFGPYETLNLHMRYLYLKNSKISRLKDNSFSGLFNLVELHFDNTYVGFVESGALNNLFNLQYLDSQNLFKYAKDIKQNTFKDLQSLAFLNLSHLSLDSTESKSFIGLEKLQILWLNNNNLTIADSTFDGLTNLKILDLSYNGMTSCDENTFTGLKSLETLHLEFNKLQVISSRVFASLNKLLELHLESNNISALEIESLYGLKALQKLHLQNNSVEEFPVGKFQYLPTLKFLNFSNNKIQELKIGALSNLQSLETLDLSNNKLFNIEYIGIFFSSKQLQSVWLDGNQLKQFDFEKLLMNLVKIKYVGISHNKWKCDTLSHIIEILINKGVGYKPKDPVYGSDNIDGIGCVDICKFVYCSHKNVEEETLY